MTPTLEQLIYEELVKQDLIDLPEHEIEFQPLERGRHYRKIRAHITNNWIKYLGLGAAGIGATVILMPSAIPAIAYTSIGGGVLGAAAGVIKPFDNMFLANPKDWVPKLFLNIAVPWSQTYSSIEIKSLEDLENFVYASRNAHVLEKEFPDHTHVLQIGIMIARTTDILYDINHSIKTISGISTEDVVRMIRNQKLRTDEEDKLMSLFNSRSLSDNDIVNLVNTLSSRPIEVISEDYRDTTKMLAKYLSNYKFRLSITGGNHIPNIGSQLSKGALRIRNSVGHNGASYMGMHSTNKDFPRIYVADNAGSSFMTRARRGFGYVGGNAEHQVLAGATGGIAIISGTTEHEFGKNMNHSSWPAIGICYGGAYQRPKQHDVKNGLLISVNRDIHFRDLPIQIWKYVNGHRKDYSIDRKCRSEKIGRAHV